MANRVHGDESSSDEQNIRFPEFHSTAATEAQWVLADYLFFAHFLYPNSLMKNRIICVSDICSPRNIIRTMTNMSQYILSTFFSMQGK